MTDTERGLLLDQLDDLITWLADEDDEQPIVFGTKDQYEWMLRLTGFVTTLLDRHHVDRRGRCDLCHESRSGWRRLLPRLRDRYRCRVWRTATYFAQSEAALVWCQVLRQRGDERSLQEVRDWLRWGTSADVVPTDEPSEQVAEGGDGQHVLLSDGRLRLRDDTLPPTTASPVRPYTGPAPPGGQSPARSVEAGTEALPKINEP